MKFNLTALSLLGAFTNFIFIILFVYFSANGRFNYQGLIIISIVFIPVYFILTRFVSFKNFHWVVLFTICMVINFILSMVCMAIAYTGELINHINFNLTNIFVEFVKTLFLIPYFLLMMTEYVVVLMLGIAVLNTFWLTWAKVIRSKIPA